MEKVNEIKRWIWCDVTAAEEKNIDITRTIGSYEGVLIENIIKEVYSRRYEADFRLVETIKVETRNINANKQKETGRVSPRRQVKYSYWTLKSSVEKQKDKRWISLGKKENSR